MYGLIYTKIKNYFQLLTNELHLELHYIRYDTKVMIFGLN